MPCTVMAAGRALVQRLFVAALRASGAVPADSQSGDRTGVGTGGDGAGHADPSARAQRPEQWIGVGARRFPWHRQSGDPGIRRRAVAAQSPLRLMLLSRSDPGAGVAPPENWRWPAGDPRCRVGVLRRSRTRPDRREMCGRKPEFRGTRWSRCARLARWLGAISGGLKAFAVPEDVRS